MTPRALSEMFRYRVTVEGKDGQEHRGAYVDTEDTLIAVKGGA